MSPIAQHTQAFEFSHLDGDLFSGKRTAFGLHLIARQVAAVFFLDGVFNRQAVAVPTGDVLRVQPLELSRLDDHVLQNLVDGVAHVNLAIGIRRAIVQDELRFAQAGIPQFFVDTFVFPFFHPAGFAFGQIAAHGEGRVGQVQGAAVVSFGCGINGGIRFGHGVTQGNGGVTASQGQGCGRPRCGKQKPGAARGKVRQGALSNSGAQNGRHQIGRRGQGSA